jgi:hypothetical protein
MLFNGVYTPNVSHVPYILTKLSIMMECVKLIQNLLHVNIHVPIMVIVQSKTCTSSCHSNDSLRGSNSTGKTILVNVRFVFRCGKQIHSEGKLCTCTCCKVHFDLTHDTGESIKANLTCNCKRSGLPFAVSSSKF